MSIPLPRLAPRSPESHKGNFGRVLLIGGSRGMSGAIALAGMAAVKAGAGLVQLAVPEPCLGEVAAPFPAYMTLGLPSDRCGRISRTAFAKLQSALQQATSAAIGPGLGRSLGLDLLVSRLYAESSSPLVVDADALNALAGRGSPLNVHAGPRILTPHPGEFRRLAPGCDRESRPAQEEHARRLAAEAHVIVVLKGHRTLVTDGIAKSRNDTGNPGMATGGSGDVLTGVIAALLGQGLDPFAASRLGVYLHGSAGDLAAAGLGEISLSARDIADALPRAFLAYAPPTAG